MLLIDVGNTRLKWARAEHGALHPGGAIAHAGDPGAALAQVPLRGAASVWIVSVAGSAHDASLDAACRARFGCAPHFARSQAQRAGLRNAYAEPQRLGADRWIALLGAFTDARGACVVADAGTALTVDAVDAGGQHLGGIIAAGLHTSERAVLGATRFPVRAVPLQPHGGLGRDTEACVRQGALLSCLGAIERAAAALPQARGYLTGGDAPVLLPLLRGTWEHRPNLVFEGLLAYATHQ